MWTSSPSKSIVKVWLYIGLFMIFFQFIIGGVTRITGSGLSITKWEIITGTLPPLNQASWESEFELYKATPQFEKINKNMTLKEFKFIYFWEYLHRLWARVMGIVFLIPFLFFLFKKMLHPALIRRLIILIFLTVIAASFGWIMVASGLIERPWVNAYKLSLHLSLACIVFVYLWWIILKESMDQSLRILNIGLRRFSLLIFILVCIQIFFGGMMSGMKAGLFYPTWPDMNGVFLPDIIFNSSSWTLENFNEYDKNGFMPALVQVLHRFTAYGIVILSVIFLYKLFNEVQKFRARLAGSTFAFVLMLQVIIGVLTLINCISIVPVFLGVLHQGIGIILLGVAFTLYFQFRLK